VLQRRLTFLTLAGSVKAVSTKTHLLIDRYSSNI
jgi:hypothetical protein